MPQLKPIVDALDSLYDTPRTGPVDISSSSSFLFGRYTPLIMDSDTVVKHVPTVVPLDYKVTDITVSSTKEESKTKRVKFAKEVLETVEKAETIDKNSSYYDTIDSCTIPETDSSSSHFRINVLLQGLNKSVRETAMVDSGATGLFLNHKFTKRHKVIAHPLRKEIPLLNIDGSRNTAGSITHYARLRLSVGDYSEVLDFLITNIGPESIILGLPWLRKVNPSIDWEKGEMRLEESKKEDSSEQGRIFRISANRVQRRNLYKAGILDNTSEEVWCAAGYTHSQRIAEEVNKAKGKRTFEEMVPKHYRAFAKVFSEEESERLPDHQPWDHTIDLKEGAPNTMRAKVYPMAINEQEELHKFLEEQLRKGYIVPSKSPMSSPVFFIKKKDGKLRLVQDYRKLNEITVKNRYPLPLASDIINRLRGASYFTKFDVRWGYNNIRIKEGDEWKATFATMEGLFEPRVMFFGMTNSPATFQALMNSVFADLVAKGVVAVYLDDILIFTATLEEHCQVVSEVLKRLQQHDLFL